MVPRAVADKPASNQLIWRNPKNALQKGMRLHLPQATVDHERPPDIAFAREKHPLTDRDPRVSLIDINELSRRLSIAKGTLYNWVYLRRIPYVKAGRCLRFDPDKVFESLRQCPTINEAGRR